MSPKYFISACELIVIDHIYFSWRNDRFWQQNVIQDIKSFITQSKVMIFDKIKSS